MDTGYLEKKAFKNGLTITALLIAYFLIMKSVGLIHQYELRGFNAVIMFTGVFLTIRAYRKHHDRDFSYLRGMSLGVLTSLTTAVSFAAFVLIFILSSPNFMEMIRQNEPHGMYLNEYGIGIVIFIEAAASGFIFSFLTMQWFKDRVPVKHPGTGYLGS
tara:strand:- start:74464 stop:74940 length:477 start_codon:yes stop_codon:yes gene_type:complete